MLLVAVASVDIWKCAIFHFLYIHMQMDGYSESWIESNQSQREMVLRYCNRWLAGWLIVESGWLVYFNSFLCTNIYRIQFGWLWLDFQKRQSMRKTRFTQCGALMICSLSLCMCVMRTTYIYMAELKCSMCKCARSSRRRCYIDFELVLSLSQAHSNTENYSHSLKLRNVSHVIRSSRA